VALKTIRVAIMRASQALCTDEGRSTNELGLPINIQNGQGCYGPANNGSDVIGQVQAAPVSGWEDHKVVVFLGQYDSHASKASPLAHKYGEDYKTRTLGEVFLMAPAKVDKTCAPAMIPSSYCGFDARTHEVQHQRGEYVALTGDIDIGSPSKEMVQHAVHRFVGDGTAFLIYSSSGATEETRKWRIIIPLVQPCDFGQWQDMQEAFFMFMESQGVAMDWALARAAQPVYLPNVPPDKWGPDGEPLFHERLAVDGSGLTPDGRVIAASLSDLRNRRAQEDAAAEQVRARAKQKAQERKVSGEGSVIDKFNKTFSIEEMLQSNGYDRGSRENWRSPYQRSKSFATRNYGDYWVSLSESDLGARLGHKTKNGCSGDAFDLFRHFEHGGDFSKAVAAAAQLLGLSKAASKGDSSAIIDLEACEKAQGARSQAVHGVGVGNTEEALQGDADPISGDHSELAGFRILKMPSDMRATEFVVDGFMPNGVTVIAGEPGAGKTTNLVPLAACAAHLAPNDWGFAVKRRRAVVWLSEHPEQVFDAIAALQQIDGAASWEEFEQWFNVLATKRSTPEALAELIAAANDRFTWTNERGIKIHPLIVWDTAAATIDVENENDNSTISKAIALAKQALGGGALWVVTHTPKAQKGANDITLMSARGGSAYEGDANCTAYLYKDTGGRRVLALGKIRFTPEFTEVHFDTSPHTETIVDAFDGEELDKTVVCGLPSKGTKDQRQQEKRDLYQFAQRYKLLQDAHAATSGGLFNGRAELYERAKPIDRNVCYELMGSMVEEGVLVEAKVPAEVRAALGLHPAKAVVIVPASVDLPDYFNRLMTDKTCEVEVHTSATDSVKSKGGVA
jgi:hypothetical protein